MTDDAPTDDAGVRLTTFHNEGLTFSVDDEGPLEGEIVVLLHGFPQTGTAWQPTAAALNGAGYRTLAPTLRGYEATSRPRGRWRYRSSRIVSDVVALIDQAGAGPVHLIGHDWGSLLAWSTAAARPDLVRSLLAVSVPHYGAFLLALLSSDQLLRSYYIVLFQLPVIPELLLTHIPGAFSRRLQASGMTAAGIDAVQDDVVDGGALTSAINWYRGLLVSNQWAMTRPVSAPTTLVWGDADTLLGRRGATLTQLFVRSQYHLEVLPGVSHWVPAERPQELAEIFVRSRARSDGTGGPVL